jgi:hypothetical protein
MTMSRLTYILGFKGDHTRTIPVKFALIWFSGFRAKDLNVIFYKNMSNLYKWYKSVQKYVVRQIRPPFEMAVVTKNR